MMQSYEMASINMLQDGMDGAMTRQDAIANNMANVNTPGYKRQEVSFQDSLQQAYMGDDSGPSLELQTAHERHLSDGPSRPVNPVKHEINSTSMRNDENNVDPDKEMAKQAKNSMYFNGLGQFERKIFSDLNSLIGQLRQA